MQSKNNIKHIIYEQLRGRIIALALKNLVLKLGIATTGGWAWLATNVIGYGLDKLLKPVVFGSVRKAKTLYRKVMGKRYADDLQDSTSNDDYLDRLNNRN